MGRRTMLLLASILVAALGTALIWLYVRSADDRALGAERLIRVYTAAAPIEPGRSVLSAGEMWISARTAPPDAVVDLKGLSGQVARSQIVKGAILQQAQFSKQGADDVTPTAEISASKDHFAVSIPLANPQRVSFLRSNMKVTIFYLPAVGKSGGDGAQLLWNDVRVLDVDGTARRQGSPAAGRTAGGDVAGSIVTLDLSQQQAQDIIKYERPDGGTLWFALKGPSQ